MCNVVPHAAVSRSSDNLFFGMCESILFRARLLQQQLQQRPDATGMIDFSSLNLSCADLDEETAREPPPTPDFSRGGLYYGPYPIVQSWGIRGHDDAFGQALEYAISKKNIVVEPCYQ